MVVFLLLLLAISVAAWYGRWHLICHFPEQYEDFHSAEKKMLRHWWR
jgi:hypothetical protein